MSALLHACVYVYPEGAWCPQRLEKAVTSPGTGIMDDCESCVGLRAKPRSRARATSTLNYRAVSQASLYAYNIFIEVKICDCLNVKCRLVF